MDRLDQMSPEEIKKATRVLIDVVRRSLHPGHIYTGNAADAAKALEVFAPRPIDRVREVLKAAGCQLQEGAAWAMTSKFIQIRVVDKGEEFWSFPTE